MAKPKKPTPQELYIERKKREEAEKEASLPPGLINHGNTCFMNSTLQGLIATQPLRDLVFFHPVSTALQPAEGSRILAKRSPQLTNGHGLGDSDELDWSEGMPLGDIFTTVMRKAWGIQDARRRETMSPKEVLTTIGRKYDQYLDFRQQDAHEFLRHMLDAMRMEELDIIKKRQPPPPKKKRRRHDKESATPLASPAHPTSALPPIPSSSSQSSQTAPQPSPVAPPEQALEPHGDDKLESFVDMLFGGQLASILVCERCKNVSITYEDFNDLSLSIKPEDYAKGRKRDRIKRIARKLRIRPPEPHRPRGMFGGVVQRASSVPASPVRRSSELPVDEEPPQHEDPRRRSFDHAGGEADEARDVVKEMAGAALPSAGLGCAIAEHEEDEDAVEITHADAAEAEGSGNGPEEKGKDKKDDAWGKIARRISVSMKLGGARDKDREKDKDKDKDSRPSSRQSERGRKSDMKDALRPKRGGEARSPRTGSLAPGASTHDSALDSGEISDPGRPRASSPVPPSPRISSPLVRPSSSRHSSTNPFSHHHHRRKEDAAKAYAAPHMSDDDMAYIRRVLADVHPVTGNPLSILQNAFSTSTSNGSGISGTTTLATQALWAKLGHLPGIEECLRMFTAVEILDGENMVGCHRCWKIANGLYKPRPREHGVSVGFDEDTDSETESESSSSSSETSGSDKSDASVAKASVSGTHPVVPGLHDMDGGAPESSPDLSSGRVSPASTSKVSSHITHSSSTTSISSAPTTVETSVSPPRPTPHARKDSVVPPETYGGLPIPKISTTEPEAPNSAPTSHTTFHADPSEAGDALTRTWSTPGAVGVAASSDSLLTPRARRIGRTKGGRKDGIEDSGESSDDEFDDSESDTSAAASARSDGSISPSVSPSASPNSSVEKLTGVSPLGSPRVHTPRGSADAAAKIPRSKQVVLRKMYKRYLISTPPPVLVIHLKRFQQSAKVHTISLSGGFKKLDDFVAFPEQLDLAPFLAPKRADFAHDQVEKGKGKTERCMYRLYAVIVHIGNMLGGHYVAYTALPQNTIVPQPPVTPTPSSTPAPPSPPVAESEKPATPSLSSNESRSSQASDPPRPQQPHQRQWAYISDTIVRLTTIEEVLKAKAYICMYERV
ncbi:cysteine proteinase [Trametes versicolor FP-101664 SS1]|uniref:cysteine proteinase n=1 Tax=Trametes versicolor (strain FP-101664) TaxID=717944 RepID=UPI000462136D|nr:cysteine proteinase [Trametes versicolor FP-101664 SS1]EIW55600.1 cysteine proteinase [Trametes versicolor FP-101664 SS1]